MLLDLKLVNNNDRIKDNRHNNDVNILLKVSLIDNTLKEINNERRK